MSLALRGVARRVDDHADEDEQLVERRTPWSRSAPAPDAAIAALRAQARPTEARDAAALQADCDDSRGGCRAYEAELDTWATDLMAEEEAMREAFSRVMSLDQVERTYGGVADPADAALAGEARRRARARPRSTSGGTA